MTVSATPGVTPATGSGEPVNQNPTEAGRPPTAAERTQGVFDRVLASITQSPAPETPVDPAPDPQAATAQELPAAAAGEGQGDDGEVLSQVVDDGDGGEAGSEDDEVKGADDKISKAFGRIKRDRKELKQKLQDAQAALRAKDAELDALRTGPTRSKDSDPNQNEIETITDLTQLEQRRAQAEDVVDQATELLARLSVNPDSVAKALEQSGIKAPADGWHAESMGEFLIGLQRKARGQLRAIPARQQYLASERVAFQQLGQMAPEIADPDSEVAKGVSAVLSRMPPQFKARPDYPVLAYVHWLGMQEYQRRLAPKKQEQAAQARPLPKPPRTPGVTNAAAPVARAGDAITQAGQQLRAKRTPEAALAYAVAAASAVEG